LDYRFDPNATYIISGGLGGVGRSIASWMQEDGAKHLVLLSRSGGARNRAAQELIADLEAKGVCVYTPKCDVSNAEEVQDAISHINRTMPPTRGLIHASMAMVVSFHASHNARKWGGAFRNSYEMLMIASYIIIRVLHSTITRQRLSMAAFLPKYKELPT
jgi:NAD(P)-dependent dehydrogenase (short-subunit alcohol dehydrogenase family)